MAGDTERLGVLASGGDPYIYNAITMGRCPPGSTRKTHPLERQSYKSVTLGGNYQLGWENVYGAPTTRGNNMGEIKAQSDITGYRKQIRYLCRCGTHCTTRSNLRSTSYPAVFFRLARLHSRRTATELFGCCCLPAAPYRTIPRIITYGGEMNFFRAKFGAMLRQKAFGGSLLEIACQSMCRDLVTAAEADIENECPTCA